MVYTVWLSYYPLLLEIENNNKPYEKEKERIIWESNAFILHVKALNALSP
jgi:hypothetical protein